MHAGRTIRASLLGGCAVLSSIVATTIAREAHAEPRDASSQADTVFREGRRAAEAGNFTTACLKFAESQRLDPSTGTLLNLGDCEEHLNHLSAARNYYQTALSQLGKSDPRVAPAQEHLAGVEGRMPRLTVRVSPTSPPGTAVSRDGVPVAPATFGIAIPVDPGAHVFVVTAPGYQDQRESMVLDDRESREFLALPGPALSLARARPDAGAPTQGPPDSNEASPPPRGARTAGWIVLGAGVVGLVVAGVSGVVLLDEKSTVANHCSRPTGCDSEGAAAASANKTWLPVNTIAWIAGVAGTGVGAYLILSAPRGHAPTAGVAVAPIGPGAGIRTWMNF
jgi:hypothetical protein